AVLRLASEHGKVLEGSKFQGTFEGLNVATKELAVSADAVFDLGAKHDEREAVVYLTPLNVSLSKAVVDFDGDRSKRFSATVTSSSARVLTDKPTPALQATVDARVKPGDALL